METRTLRTINDIQASAWNEIVGNNRLICRHEYLKAIEASQINDCRFFYPVIYDGDTIIAHTCLYFISTELDSFAQGLTKTIINGIRKIWKQFLILQTLECGTPVALGNTISFRDGADKPTILNMIVKETEKIAKELGVKVVLFRDFYENELGLFNNLCDMGYRKIHNLPCARLEVQWNTFDEYRNDLRSGYRNKMMARIKKFQKSNSSLEVTKNVSSYANELTKLWKNVYDHATEYRREILPPDFFENLEAHMEGHASVILAKLGDKITGFILLFHDDETLIPIFCGLDYEYNKKQYTYFNLFYKTIEIAINTKMRDIDFGITTLIPKIEMGATPVTLHMYMKHSNPILNMIVPNFFEMMTPNKLPEQRKAFAS